MRYIYYIKVRCVKFVPCIKKLSECTMSRDKKVVPKAWVVGCLYFCLKVTKIYQLDKIENIVR